MRLVRLLAAAAALMYLSVSGQAQAAYLLNFTSTTAYNNGPTGSFSVVYGQKVARTIIDASYFTSCSFSGVSVCRYLQFVPKSADVSKPWMIDIYVSDVGVYARQLQYIFDPATQIAPGVYKSVGQYDATISILKVPGRAPVGDVPEPSTWALMIVGFGAIGAAMRRQGRGRVPALA